MTILIQKVLARLRPAPADWFEGLPEPDPTLNQSLPPLPCESYAELVEAWSKTLYWTEELDLALSAMLAVCLSTKQQGDQIWLRVIGVAGTGKSTLCLGITASEAYCKPISLATGLYSGTNEGLIEKVKDKTAVVNEGDVFLNSPNIDQTMGELRDLWTGEVHVDYKNGVNLSYKGVRSTWILAGTKAIRRLNHSSLGDRFIDVIIYERDRKLVGMKDKRQTAIVEAHLQSQWDRTLTLSDGKPESHDGSDRIEAKRKTAGYIQYLRENSERVLAQAVCNADRVRVGNICDDLGTLTAWMRTRPSGSGEDTTEAELPTRLSGQLQRFSMGMAGVTNKTIDDEVIRRVARLADATCYGDTYKVCKELMERPLDIRQLSTRIGRNDSHIRTAVGTLSEIGCVRPDTLPAPSGAQGRGLHVYRLLPYTAGLLVKMRELTAGSLDMPSAVGLDKAESS